MPNYSSGFLRWIIAVPLLLVIGYFSFTTVTMIIASPFNDALSSKLLRNMTLSSVPDLVEGWRATVRSFVDSAGIVARQVFLIALCLPLLLIPLIGPLPMFLVAAYFAGLGFVAVAAAQHGLTAQQRKTGLETQR